MQPLSTQQRPQLLAFEFLGPGGRAGFCSSDGGVMAATLFAARNHCDSVGWDTPTCRASVAALTPLGPTILFTICVLNASVYGTATACARPHWVVSSARQPRRHLP